MAASLASRTLISLPSTISLLSRPPLHNLFRASASAGPYVLPPNLNHFFHLSRLSPPSPRHRSYSVECFSNNCGFSKQKTVRNVSYGSLGRNYSTESGHKASAAGTRIVRELTEKELEGEMRASFKCKVCETRNDHRFSKLSYYKGVVLGRCPGCKKHHLIADNLGWFSDNRKNLETMMQEKGEAFQRFFNEDTFAAAVENLEEAMKEGEKDSPPGRSSGDKQ